MDTPTKPTTLQLLDTLRSATGLPHLEFVHPPTRLSGGFYAEMFRFLLADPPPGLTGDLVARIVPNPAAGAWEATIQRAVADQGFATPAVRVTAPESGPLGRYLIVMDAVDGAPPMAGLGIANITRQIPALVRDLPDQLAHIAADLHLLDPEPLAVQLTMLESPILPSTAEFVEEQAGYAVELDRPDLARAAERLLMTEPRSTERVITHGDLHPFNLLLSDSGPVLIDWTVAGIAHPAFTLGFTDLMLANPPIPLPKVAAAALQPIARNIARRFLRTYHRLTHGTRVAVTDEQLAWHRKVHALRILVEIAGWEVDGTHPVGGHPWLTLEPVAEQQLGLVART